MIGMLLLLFRKESFLTVPFVACLLGLLVQNFASATCCIAHNLLESLLEHEQITRQAAQAKDIIFYTNGTTLDYMTEFKYLGHIFSADWDDAAVLYNIKKTTKA